MNKMIEELKKVVNFKNDTIVGDHVLIISKEPQVAIYALVNSIQRDQSRKDEWWHVGMTLLTLPPQNITWTLREEQFTGQVIFTMQGIEHFIQAVRFGEANTGQSTDDDGHSNVKKKDDKSNPFHRVK